MGDGRRPRDGAPPEGGGTPRQQRAGGIGDGVFRAYARTRDRALRDELVLAHLDVARAIARRYARRGEPLDDLEQVAALGLLKAIERFDPDRGTPFLAFAVPTIVGEVRRHFRDRGWTVRAPRGIQELRVHLHAHVGELSQALGRSPSVSEIARHAGVREEDVLEALEAPTRYRPLSLQRSHVQDGRRGRRLEDGLAEHAAGMERVENEMATERLLARLPERERTILRLKFFEDLSQSEIAARLGISQMHVSRLMRRALETLRALDRGAEPAPTLEHAELRTV